MSQTDDLSDPVPSRPGRPPAERRAELERIRDAMWPPNESAEERAARVARNLAALDEALRRPASWDNLDAATIKWLAEDPDVSDMQ
jgi:hypothetical protein